MFFLVMMFANWLHLVLFHVSAADVLRTFVTFDNQCIQLPESVHDDMYIDA
jgi:hypothetical protein